jgi:predicted dehydrogenase
VSSSRQRLRIAVAGCGGIARQYHLRVLRSTRGARVVAVADPDAAARNAAARLTAADPYADPQEAIDRPDVDAVVVCAPNAHHAPLAMAALGAGRHLYLEKPLATSAGDGRRVTAAAERAGTAVTLGLAYRFDPLYQRARAALPMIGRVREVSTTWLEPSAPGWPAWKRTRAEGGGALLDLGVHHLDLLRWLTGESLAGVDRAELSSVAGEHDSAWVSAALSSGASFEARFGYSAERRCSWLFAGDEGLLGIDRCMRRVWVRRSGQGPVRRTGTDALRSRVLTLPLIRRERVFGRALRAWVAHATGSPRAPQLATTRDGLATLEDIESIEAATFAARA